MIARNYIVQELPEIHCNLLFSFPGGTIAMDIMISFWKGFEKKCKQINKLPIWSNIFGPKSYLTPMCSNSILGMKSSTASLTEETRPLLDEKKHVVIG